MVHWRTDMTEAEEDAEDSANIDEGHALGKEIAPLIKQKFAGKKPWVQRHALFTLTVEILEAIPDDGEDFDLGAMLSGYLAKDGQ
jgi:hypothetical protein